MAKWGFVKQVGALFVCWILSGPKNVLRQAISIILKQNLHIKIHLGIQVIVT